ncbi:TetR family transcriptional regulator [Sulfidibacter corallicola]|uniref:TetR family transcriptional regulator n=1 Tax=Sulfidibacter corallicola TaxID=2818388 RepID=A0A8A4TTM4_SULCO|nr:TetR/AcrR family transcriptional regulator [Sulfidibacter corallicola]QTD49885.1 TetR family transcriptional regulator [Sulfidibacter corallicola]
MTSHVKDRRQELLQAAARLFREKGFAKTTVRDISRAVGLQSGSLFHHFATKEDILYGLMVDVIELNTARLQRAFDEADSAASRVLALIRAELEAIHGETRDAMTVLVFEWRQLTEGRREDVLNLRDRYEALWLRALEGLAAEGRTAVESFTLRRLLVGAISWTVNWYKPTGSMDLDTLAEQVLTLALKNPEA